MDGSTGPGQTPAEQLEQPPRGQRVLQFRRKPALVRLPGYPTGPAEMASFPGWHPVLVLRREWLYRDHHGPLSLNIASHTAPQDGTLMLPIPYAPPWCYLLLSAGPGWLRRGLR